MTMAVEEEKEERISEGFGQGMPIFSENPKSFKIDRKSPLASRLSSSISRELLHFLGNYTDDVLSEYITVLVCNGKHQYQARDDLEAFLGKRSGEFVSWLWDFLMKCCPQSTLNRNALILQCSIVNSPDGSDMDVKANRMTDLQNCRNGDANEAPNEDAMLHCLPFNCNPLLPPIKEFPNGSQHFTGLVAPINEVNAENLLPKALGNEIQRKGVPAGGEESSQHMDKYRKIASCAFPNQLLHLRKKDPVPKKSRCHISEESSSRRTLITKDDSESVPPRETYRMPHQIDKSRRSVWDRLGKPCENTPTTDSTDGCIVHPVNQVPGNHSLSVFVHSELWRKRCNGSNPSGEYKKADYGVSAGEKTKVANIRQKRHFGEISTGPSTDLIHPMGEESIVSHYEQDSQDLRKSNWVKVGAGTVNTPLLSDCSPSAVKLDSTKNEQGMISNRKPMQAEMHDVKRKLHQIEMELAKLGSKQVEMKRHGRRNLLSSSGLKQSEEDINLRTVTVTNVHFAANKDALSKYFSKCGLVINVTLSDEVASKPKGTAYVTFATKEAVDKAVALSGASFLSRTMKIVRKSEEAAAPSTQAQAAGNPRRARLSRISRMVAVGKPYQWRRDNVSATSSTQSLSTVRAVASAKSTTNGSNQ